MTNEPLISIALVTRNRADSLERALKSLRAQSFQPFEVVISDDSDPEKAAETRQLAEQYNCMYTEGPRLGLYSNRNRAASLCSGTHIRTMDDDHEFLDGHFAKCREAVRQDPTAIWVIGEFHPDDEPKDPLLRIPGQLNPRGFSTLPPDPQNCWAISDGASIYPAIVRDSGVLYCEDYKFGATYLEFGSRLHWLGYRIRFLTTSSVIHNVEYSEIKRDSVWFGNPEIELSARFFAIFCHSFYYQATLRNKLVTLIEVAKQLVLRPALTSRAIRRGLASTRKRMSEPSFAADGALKK